MVRQNITTPINANIAHVFASHCLFLCANLNAGLSGSLYLDSVRGEHRSQKIICGGVGSIPAVQTIGCRDQSYKPSFDVHNAKSPFEEYSLFRFIVDLYSLYI